MEDDFRGPKPVDLVVPVAPKDYIKLDLFIASVRANIDVQTIHIITPTPEAIGKDWPSVKVHSDADVFPYDRRELCYRPNWLFQMMLKVFQNVTENDWFVVMDADIFASKRIPLWAADGRPVFCIGRERQDIDAYWNFNQAMLGFPFVQQQSFLTECVLYNKLLVQEMVKFGGFGSMDDWWHKCVSITHAGCHMADAELYGTYVFHEHPDLYERRNIISIMGGHYGLKSWDGKNMERELELARGQNPGAHLVSLHTWADWEG